MKTPSLLAMALALALLPVCANAQQMTLQLQDGRVTLDAQNVPVRQILAEWARVGGAKIVNGEKVLGAPLTLQLQGVPEREALEIILRGVSGYMLAARQVGSGVSAFDRIMILPTSTPPRGPAATQAGGFGNPAVNRPMMPQPVQAEPAEEIIEDGDNDDPEPEEANDGEGEPSAEAQPQHGNANPNMNPDRFRRRPGFPNPMGAQAQPFMPQGGVQVYPGQPVNVPPQQGQEAQPPTATNPFGVPAGASAQPGVISPVPQQNGTQPGQTPTTTPTTTRRPPGVQ
jgi:hypothetical protein